MAWGELSFFDEDLVVPDTQKSIEDGAIAPWSSKNANWYRPVLAGLAKHYKQSTKKPWRSLSSSFRNKVLYGTGDTEIKVTYEGDGHVYTYKKPFEGVMNNLQRRMTETGSENVRDNLADYTRLKPCDDCHGTRLRAEARVVRVADHAIHDVTRMSVAAAEAWFESLTLDRRDAAIAERLLKEIRERLGFLTHVGLGYLSLERRAGTLSGGESQRIRLATQIGRSLVGVLYILDEPSIGLHQRDNARLLQTLQRLRDLGNTVLVVEHDEDTIGSADWIIDMGPRAGVHGGEVVAAGTPAAIRKHRASLTGAYLSGRQSVPVPDQRRPIGTAALEVQGARANNLREVTARFPLGVLTCVTGVSGSGKSTLVNETLRKALAHTLNGAHDRPADHDQVVGLEHVDKVIDIDQSPIGRTPRSNPATYTGLFGDIRDLFANLPEAKIRGYKPGRFSFNVKGGRCEACEGDGILKIEMHFLPDVYVQCETCNGRRYNRETLAVTYKGKSIADVLEMTVSEALDFLGSIPPIRRKLETLQSVGLGYIHLGQQATTLSGGEAQRIKLSKELARRSTGKTVYILDEPTTGLHFDDVRKLLDVLHQLVDQGNTVIVIEHNLDVIKTADWVIDLGPEGGDGGGKVVAEGPPEVIARSGTHTGQFLSKLLVDHQNGTAAPPRRQVKKKRAPRRKKPVAAGAGR